MRGPCACPRPGERIQRVSMNPWRNRHSRGQAQGPHPSPHPPLVPTERRGRTRPDGRDYPLRLEKFIRMQDAPSPIRSAPFIRRQGRKRLNGYDSPIRSSKFIRVLPILVVKTHHRAPALACSSTNLYCLSSGRTWTHHWLFTVRHLHLILYAGKGMGGVP